MTKRYFGLKRWQWGVVVLWVVAGWITVPPTGIASAVGSVFGAFVAAYLISRVVSVVNERFGQDLRDFAEGY